MYFFFHVIFGLLLFQYKSHWKSDRIYIKYIYINYEKIDISVIVNLPIREANVYLFWGLLGSIPFLLTF